MERNGENQTHLSFDFYPEAVIVGGGDYPIHSVPLNWIEHHNYVVFCDGAANQCINKNITPRAIVGDGDSISPIAKKKYADIIHINPDQETNDQTKAVNFIKQLGYSKIAIVAATGRREDHTIANISLLMEYFKEGLDVRMYTDNGVFIPCKDNSNFIFPIGTAVSIFSFGTKGMKSQGLAYPLYDFTHLWQGTLNHTTNDSFSIECQGYYLIFVNYENKKIRE